MITSFILMSVVVLLDEDAREALRREIVDAVVSALAPTKEPESVAVDGEKMAELLGVSRQTLDRMKSEKKIPFMRMGRCVRFRPADVFAALSAEAKGEDDQ